MGGSLLLTDLCFRSFRVEAAVRDVIQLLNLNIGSLEKIESIRVDAVGNVIHQAGNSGVDQGLGAIDAGKM